MAEVTIQRTGEFIRKLFEILIAHPEGMKAQDALAALRASVQLTEFEKGFYSSGSPRFEKIVRFATVDCVKAGWMIKENGRWIATSEGITAFRKITSPEDFYRSATRLYRDWKAKTKKTSHVVQKPLLEETAEKTAVITIEKAQEQAWGEIEDYLKNMNPYELQKLVAALLKAMGYHINWISPPGKDSGVDIWAWNDPLGTKPPRIKVQVKREGNPINVSQLRSFMALLGDDDVGLFVSTGGFTRDAEDEARKQQSRQVTLVNLERLFQLWIEFMKNMGQDDIDRLPLKPIYFLNPEG